VSASFRALDAKKTIVLPAVLREGGDRRIAES
jgi:hypothetical protein